VVKPRVANSQIAVNLKTMLQFNRSQQPSSSWVSLSLAAVLGMGGIWLVPSVSAQTAVQSDIARASFVLERQPNESYETLIGRAEALARAAALRNFNRDGSVQAVSVTIVGQNQGAAAPILSLQVNRQNWNRSPNIQRWAKYFPSSQTLLGLAPTPTNTTAQTGDADGQAPANAPVTPANGAPGVVPGGGTSVTPAANGAPGTPTNAAPGTPTNAAPGTPANAAPGTPTNAAPGTRATPGNNNNNNTGTPAGNNNSNPNGGFNPIVGPQNPAPSPPGGFNPIVGPQNPPPRTNTTGSGS
jgi:hypothetical protein